MSKLMNWLGFNRNAELREQLARLDGMIEVTRELRRELQKEPTQ